MGRGHQLAFTCAAPHLRPHNGSRAQALRHTRQICPLPKFRRFPGDARPEAAAPAAALFPRGGRQRPDARLALAGQESRARRVQYSPGGGGRLRSAESGAGDPRLSGALGRAPTRRRLQGRCPLCSPRASLAAPGPSRTAGGCPGNGRAQVAFAAAPVYYCYSGYFLFGGLGEIKKSISKVGRRKRRAEARQPVAA